MNFSNISPVVVRNKYASLLWMPENFMEVQDKMRENMENLSIHCAVCLDNFPESLTPCLHAFHLTCINEWVSKNNKCPLCSSQQISFVRMYCKQCLKYFHNMAIPLYNSRSDYNEGLPNQRCPTCA